MAKNKILCYIIPKNAKPKSVWVAPAEKEFSVDGEGRYVAPRATELIRLDRKRWGFLWKYEQPVALYYQGIPRPIPSIPMDFETEIVNVEVPQPDGTVTVQAVVKEIPIIKPDPEGYNSEDLENVNGPFLPTLFRNALRNAKQEMLLYIAIGVSGGAFLAALYAAYYVKKMYDIVVK